MTEGLADRPIEPLEGPLDAVVHVPGSKSITNRALLVAALADGPSRLSGVLEAEDTAAMIDCLRRLGVVIQLTRPDDVALVVGTAARWPLGPVHLDARQSGTTARFLPAALALGRGRYRLDGASQLRSRPFAPLFGALRQLGVGVQAEPGERLPVEITSTGATTWGDEVAVSGDVSSQYISGLMMAAPLSPAGLRIRLTTPLVSAPYLAVTAAVMADFGASASIEDDLVVVPAGRYQASSLRIEADASAASYFFGAAALCGGTVRVEGLGNATHQGDAAFAEVLASMGCTVRRGPNWTAVSGPQDGVLRGVSVDLADLSDTAPTLAVVAAFATSPTQMSGIGFIRHKESDRIGAVVAELRRLGVEAEEQPDGMIIRPGVRPMAGTTVQTYDDHRMAMAFALAGLRIPGVAIADPGCVAKTFPRFWEVLDGLRLPRPR